MTLELTTRLLHSGWTWKTQKCFQRKKKIHFRISLKIKTFHFNFSPRLWWRSHIACTKLLESRRLESFADLRAHMECTPTFLHTSTTSRKLCGPRLFSLSRFFDYCQRTIMMTNVVMANTYRYWNFVREQFAFDSSLRNVRKSFHRSFQFRKCSLH